MGYACPVCGDPQSDAEHLANHVAFTALLGDADHEGWLETHAPDWDQADATSLAETVADHAEAVEFPQVFEDTTGAGHDHETGADRSGDLFDDESDVTPPGRDRAARDRGLDAQAEQILADAQKMTRQMLARADDGGEGTAANDEGAGDQAADDAHEDGDREEPETE
jgi:prophage tail gpP-like protein